MPLFAAIFYSADILIEAARGCFQPFRDFRLPRAAADFLLSPSFSQLPSSGLPPRRFHLRWLPELMPKADTP